MTHSVMLALPASQVTPSRHGDLPSCGTFGPAIHWRRAWTVFSEVHLLPVIHGACKGPRDGSQGQGCVLVGRQGLDRKRRDRRLDGTDRTDRTVFVTCHAALLQPRPSVCVCISLGCVAAGHLCMAVKSVRGASIQRRSSESLPPLDRSCVFHSCWLD